MDKTKIYGLLGLCMKAGGLVFGTDSCIDSIKRKKVKLVLVAQDAAQRTKKNFEMNCKQSQIPIYFFGSIEELSKSIGKTNKAVFGIQNKNFADAIQKIINGGEIIG